MRPGHVRSPTRSAVAAAPMAVVVMTVALTASMACGERSPGGPSPVDPSSSDNDSGVRQADDFGGRQLFPSDNWWNQEISGAWVDPQSNAYLDFIGRTRMAHPDFGPAPYGFP